jgi:hypothetical protein
MLTNLTLTGADSSTSIEGMFALHEKYKFLEFGVLYHGEKAGTGRYPPPEWLAKLVDWVGLFNYDPPNLSLHLCGVTANRAFISGDDLFGIRASGVCLSDVFERVQMNVNMAAGPFTVADIQRSIERHPDVNVITQDNQSNLALLGYLPEATYPTHQILFDASGGRGNLPKAWPKSVSSRLCGYAGGLRLENLADEMVKIFRAAGGKDHWIDLESGVRDANDKFSLDLCEKVADLVSRELVLAVPEVAP